MVYRLDMCRCMNMEVMFGLNVVVILMERLMVMSLGIQSLSLATAT